MKETTNEANTDQYGQTIHLQQNTSSFGDLKCKSISSIENESVRPNLPTVVNVKQLNPTGFILRSNNHKKLAAFVLQNGPEFMIPQTKLSSFLGINIQAIKRALERFSIDGFAEHTGAYNENGERTTFIRLLNPDTYDLSPTMSSFDTIQASSLDRQIERNSFCLSKKEEQVLLELDSNDFRTCWPNLYEMGFGPSQIQQIVKSRSKIGASLSQLRNSLDYIEYELSEGICVDKEGDQFRKAGAFVSGLIRYGSWRRPDTYKTNEEIAKEERLAKLQHLKELKMKELEAQKLLEKQKDEESFTRWKNSLSVEEIVEYTQEWQQKYGHLAASEERILKLKWGKLNTDIHSNP